MRLTSDTKKSSMSLIWRSIKIKFKTINLLLGNVSVFMLKNTLLPRDGAPGAVSRTSAVNDVTLPTSFDTKCSDGCLNPTTSENMTAVNSCLTVSYQHMHHIADLCHLMSDV